MKKYPKFLKALPQFYGLEFIDLGFLLIGLNLGLILGLESITTLGFVAALIVTSRLIRKRVDIVGILVPRKKSLKITDSDSGDL